MRPTISLACIKEYDGPLHWKVSEKTVCAAMQSYYGQKHRSKLAHLPPPQYSIREFVAWWLEELSHFEGEDPTCGRIDHSRGYSWDNICLQSRAENSRECALRLRKGTKENKVKNEKPVFVYSKESGDLISTFPSRKAASEFFGTPIQTIALAIRRGTRRRDCALKNFTLRGVA